MKRASMTVKVHDIVGENAITLEDGQAVYDLIAPKLASGQQVAVDFRGVQVFASPFFNAAFGQLLRDAKAADLNRLLTISHLIPTGLDVLRRVIENAKQYYSSPDYRAAQEQVLREISEQD